MIYKYKIVLSKSAEKFIRKQDRNRKKQILKILDNLESSPYNLPNVKPIKGTDFEDYRCRFGDFRMIYRVESDILTILVLDIGSRGDIYKRL
ncbi:type II toxin-antitoxin system RelE family toxin [Fredinandcohnia onubensis]|uniref:type II toxin-antitoxin system RelE family toxin n=1 Tax=Fredinandcohnia onubensis TaxID=1571209 RepID=UPI000C0BE528|nr:type II toxin-antitoxin system RelE/ParE family toxin [Fredinandcohnia onubensis]